MDTKLARLIEDPRVAAAVEFVRRSDELTLASQVQLSEIPAPPFGEERRGERMAQLMLEAGIPQPRADPVGNVVGTRPGVRSEPPLVVSAHLDTVFPAGTDVAVTREGDLLRGPGISDDARGLATLLAVAGALQDAGIRTRVPLLFVATVGEEGVGDLRGVRQLFADDRNGSTPAGFISLDGAGLERIVVKGLGSRRFRITARGPGGHSWVDWGTPNPIHALGKIAHRLARVSLPKDPVTTLTIARWGGGKSINAIPQEAWIELDTRCEVDDRLASLESEIRRTVDDASESASGEIVFEIASIGLRPGGETPPGTPLVEAALAATRSQGCEPVLALSSTDANIPMSKGIPAITIGCGGEAGQAHTTDEWYRNVRGVEGVLRTLYTILLIAGIED
jgi:acetylornithine deacetylase/succinyl-diaminopimelate desuccinylase-like protein